MQRLLIADSDTQTCVLIQTYAQVNDFLCNQVHNGKAVLKALRHSEYDLVIMNTELPEMDGFDALSEIRRTSDIPVVLLGSKKEEYDLLYGFNLGADDYLFKPFNPKELMARIKAILKRGRMYTENAIKFGELDIREHSRMVTVGGKEITLTPKEFDLLLFLAKNNRLVFSREQLLENVWGFDYEGDIRTVDTHIKSLRERLGEYRSKIVTIWGVGYKFLFNDE